MDNKRTPAVGGKAKEGRSNKKQATPSQVRASHEKQKQRQAAGKQAPPVKANGRGANSNGDAASKGEKQLEAKVKSLHEQADKSLGAYAKKANEMRNQISAALERQDQFHKVEQLNNVDGLRESILELTNGNGVDEQQVTSAGHKEEVPAVCAEPRHPGATCETNCVTRKDSRADVVQQSSDKKSTSDQLQAADVAAAPNHDVQENISTQPAESRDNPQAPTEVKEPTGNWFEPLSARLDPKSKYVALKASLERHFASAPHLLEPICQKFLYLTNQIDALTLCNEQQQAELQKLTSIKTKLGDLCRELQKSNNQIRIESLDIIKGEQNKAKEQAVKIQSTLSGVMKLFDENQQRNLALKQENVELQGKLKALLEHCDNWEKCVETTLKQREIENRLAKTEMARLSLIRNEEKEKFFKEKSELLRALTMMKEQQSKIEDKEAKLRSDLTNYASKYDECQEIIHKGLSKFQVESKRMLKQIEQGRHDYIQLLNKYEASNKKIKHLLEEKQSWAQSMSAANNKLEALERLCRALKAENDRLQQQQQQKRESPPEADCGDVTAIKVAATAQKELINAPAAGKPANGSC